MIESKIIRILVIGSIILSLTGALLMWQGSGASVSLFSQKSEDKVKSSTFLGLMVELAGLKKEQTYLILFQNNLEIRPGGGYLGNFGIVKVRNGNPHTFEIHDTNIFDGFGTVQTEPPTPMKIPLNISNWQMRDSNWSPDFPTSAQKVEYFYHLQGGTEQFDGVVGINATILPELLELTGDIYLKEFDKTFSAKDVLYDLEQEVEKKYIDRNLEEGDRKAIFKALVKETLSQVIKKNFWRQSELKDFITNQFNKKNIIIYLKDKNNQETVSKLGWDGSVDIDHNGDYLMIVEANLAGKKSNFFVKREVEYFVDFTKQKPVVKLRIKFTHQGKERDWFNADYNCYLRVYVPKGSWLTSAVGVRNKTVFLDELNKTVFGNFIRVPVGRERIVEFSYLLPERLRSDVVYKMLIQKQIGVDQMPVSLNITDIYGQEHKMKKEIDRDWEISIGL